MIVQNREIKPLNRTQIRELRKAGYDLFQKCADGTVGQLNGEDLDLLLSAAFPGDEMEGIGISGMTEIASAIMCETLSGETEKN